MNYADESEVDLIKMILRVNPAHRPSVLQILAHPYLFIHDAKTKTLFNEERAKTV